MNNASRLFASPLPQLLLSHCVCVCVCVRVCERESERKRERARERSAHAHIHICDHMHIHIHIHTFTYTHTHIHIEHIECAPLQGHMCCPSGHKMPTWHECTHFIARTLESPKTPREWRRGGERGTVWCRERCRRCKTIFYIQK